MQLGLENKRVLVTGSSRGIGLGIAQEFVREGAQVAFCGREKKDLKTLLPTGVNLQKDHIWQSCDFTKTADVEKLRDRLVQEWKGLDILVCNVGHSKSVADAIPEDESFTAMMETNFFSAVRAMRAFLPLLANHKEGDEASVVVISSIAGREAFAAAPTDYCVAKSALVALAKNTAKKLAEKKVRVNCVAPGNIFFPGGRWEEKKRENSDRVVQMLKERVPMQRFGTPAEIADLVVFLSSARARFITGAVIDIDGGQRVGF